MGRSKLFAVAQKARSTTYGPVREIDSATDRAEMLLNIKWQVELTDNIYSVNKLTNDLRFIALRALAWMQILPLIVREFVKYPLNIKHLMFYIDIIVNRKYHEYKLLMFIAEDDGDDYYDEYYYARIIHNKFHSGTLGPLKEITHDFMGKYVYKARRDMYLKHNVYSKAMWKDYIRKTYKAPKRINWCEED